MYSLNRSFFFLSSAKIRFEGVERNCKKEIVKETKKDIKDISFITDRETDNAVR